MDEELQKLLERVEKLEKSLAEKDTKISALETQNTELLTKLTTLKVDSLVRKVEDTPAPVVEDISFDFDI